MAATEGTDLKALEALLAERLAKGPLPAEQFMALALYHPEHGYYRQLEGRWGFEGGDYFTALDCGPLLGEAVALRLQNAWEQMERPAVFTVLEVGAGRGWLGRDILNAAREPFASALRYVHRDDSPAACHAAQIALEPWIKTDHARLSSEAEAEKPFKGAVLSNELFDAIPAQPWRWDGARWMRQMLTQEGPTWEEADAEEAGDWFASQAEDGLHPGDASIWRRTLPTFLKGLCETLQEGLFLAVDYGDTAARLLAKGAGLRRYRTHRVDERWWEQAGESDLTADVDFSHLVHVLEELGLQNIQDRALGRWVREHAPLKDLEARWQSMDASSQRKVQENLVQLELPSQMGERFRVLEAWKGTELK